jgi:formylmethanofuran dehydrogenase subunit A
MGYTMLCNPSMPPLEARHTHEELNDIPLTDKATFPLLGNSWFVLEYLSKGMIEECAQFVAWLFSAIKGYAIKIVNPGGVEAWGFGKNVGNLDQVVSNFNITPRQIIQGLCEINSILKLPHTIHLHTNNLGIPGNFQTTLDTMKCVENLYNGLNPILHITHCQFCAFKGDDWSSFRSGAREIADYVNIHDHVTLDMGQIVFTDTTTMTADGPWQYKLYGLTGNKWINHDVEVETSGGIVPFKYSRKNYVHATMWSIGLELALLVEDPWKIYLTTDHPNGGPFFYYPKIISWLMSGEARRKILKKISKKAARRSNLNNIDREFDFYEIAIVTRAGQAKALGLKNKGHLGVGADADVAIYDLNPKTINPSKEHVKIRNAFQQAMVTIKNGEIVSKNNQVIQTKNGKTFWIDLDSSFFSEKEYKIFLRELKNKFRDYWSVELSNYLLTERVLKFSSPIKIKSAS